MLSIGGLDPGGGAGILADARAISKAGAFACGVAAVLTVQSTAGLVASEVVSPKLVGAQAKEVLTHQNVRAMKTGALGSAANVLAVARLASLFADLPLVVDPVLLPSRGKGRLLAADATRALYKHLIPRATLVTANVPEAEALLGVRITSVADAREAAAALVEAGAHAALVKGGHLAGIESVDVLSVRGQAPLLLRATRLTLGSLHGGGCTLASLIAGKLATGAELTDAVRWAKKTHYAALGRAVRVGGRVLVLVP